MPQNSLLVQIPPGSQPQQMPPQSIQGNIPQGMPRNGVRKMTPKGGPQVQPPPQQPRMVQPQGGQPMPQSFQNATYMHQVCVYRIFTLFILGFLACLFQFNAVDAYEWSWRSSNPTNDGHASCFCADRSIRLWQPHNGTNVLSSSRRLST